MAKGEEVQRENQALLLRELALLARDPEHPRNVIVAGRSWYDWTDADGAGYIGLHEGDCSFQVRAAWTVAGFRWEWTRKLAEGVYLRYDGGTNSLEAAALAAITMAPEYHDFDYLGKSWRWWLVSSGKWLAEIEGETAEVFLLDYHEKQPKFGWTRRCAAFSEVLKFVDRGRGGLSGEVSTKEDAFRACVDAPDLFRRACGALVSRCSELRRASSGTAIISQSEQAAQPDQAGAAVALQPELGALASRSGIDVQQPELVGQRKRTRRRQ